MALKLNVTKLAWKTDDASLRAAFAPFGELVEAKVAKNWETGISRRLGHVIFARDEDAERALAEMAGAEVDGSAIAVVLAPGQTRASSAAASAPEPDPGETGAEDVTALTAAEKAAGAVREQRATEREEGHQSEAARRRQEGGVGGVVGRGNKDLF